MRVSNADRIGKKTKRKRVFSKESIKRYLHDYCQNTTIHGFKYISEHDRPNIERICWIFVFGLSMAGSTYFINKVWQKWRDSPVIITFSETLTPIWEIPFPTVTICSETKVRQSIFNFTYAMFSTNLTENEKQMRDDISLICDSGLTTNGSKFTNESTIDMIKELAPQFQDIMWSCLWNGYSVHCFDMFIPVITEEGICFSFNTLFGTEIYRDIVVQSESEEYDEILTTTQWTLEEGYAVTAVFETEPIRTIAAGVQAGFTITLRDYDYDTDYLCHGPAQGFKILLHTPVEIPRLSERYFILPHDQELMLSVKPNMITASENLRSYHPSSRQCYFSSERYLAYFKVYTQRNCELECLTNYTLKKCQCAAIYMPRLQSTSLCGAGSKTCMDDASEELKIEEIMLRMQKTQTPRSTCDCLPSCTSLQYDAETSLASYNLSKLYDAYKGNKSDIDGVHMSRIAIYFRDDQFITSVRSELYTVVDFLAICGGLLGLFSGISVLSFIEIIYYLTLRLYYNLRSQKDSTGNNTTDDNFHPHVIETDPNEKKNHDRVIVTYYRYQP